MRHKRNSLLSELDEDSSISTNSSYAESTSSLFHPNLVRVTSTQSTVSSSGIPYERKREKESMFNIQFAHGLTFNEKKK